MREILFRGQRFDGVWFEGYFFAKPILEKYFIIIGEDQYMVKPETVGQYTGLIDKNGLKIFEGDIVTIPDSKKMGLPALIRYDYVRATFEVSRSGYNPLSLIDAREFYEVIGNIHDNPELLKEGGE